MTASDAPQGKAVTWAGRFLTFVPAAMLVMSGVMKLLAAGPVLENWGPKFGYPPSTLTAIGVTELLCAVLYLVPRTAVFGAILVTGYLGGAVATHVRVGDPFLAPALLGAAAWGGLWFRDARLRALLPFRG